MRPRIIVAFLIGALGTYYFVAIKPPYQGRQTMSVSENFAKREMGDNRPLTWTYWVEVSESELEAVGIDWKTEIAKSDHDSSVVITDYKKDVRTLYLRFDQYKANRGKIESMRPTKWW